MALPVGRSGRRDPHTVNLSKKADGAAKAKTTTPGNANFPSGPARAQNRSALPSWASPDFAGYSGFNEDMSSQQERFGQLMEIIRTAVDAAFGELYRAVQSAHAPTPASPQESTRAAGWSLALGVGIALGALVGVVVGAVVIARRLLPRKEAEEERQPEVVQPAALDRMVF